MPGNTKTGSALAVAGENPAANRATVAANARGTRRTTLNSHPSGPSASPAAGYG
ncbi:Uncharacterised protein [Mycobacterium tuberculosis]|uniref:Uncharacterized protein n=1 Tax=Mycobacterium tuberculosis TaxID=1773 RepID=A0A655APD4_MYCTX|nr:Uncharacterised protein [Mycobacterium tuberculosis]CKT96499.1 Uncharacterised protein [Mycobacterium tuberculosis]